MNPPKVTKKDWWGFPTEWQFTGKNPRRRARVYLHPEQPEFAAWEATENGKLLFNNYHNDVEAVLRHVLNYVNETSLPT